MRYGLSVLLSLSTVSIAHAVSYELPMDSGWYQLQDSSTYETLCSTGSGLPCDVPPGDYVLINHNVAVGQPDHRKIVSIGNQDNGPTIVYETKTCLADTYRDYNTQILLPSGLVGCSVQCTTGMLTGGSCSATYTGAADADEYSLNTRTRMTENGFACSLTSYPGAEPYTNVGNYEPARFTIGLACLK